MSELVDLGPGSIVISDEHIPFSAYQAIYHKLTRKVESINRTYEGAYTITYQDIKNLDDRFRQLLTQYSLKGSRKQITHSTKEGYSRTYSSLERFSLSDLTVREITSTLGYELDFLIVLPAEIKEAEEIAQRYKIQFTVAQSYIDKDDDKMPYFIRDFVSLGSLGLEIEYSDYSVAQALEAVVTGWINTLPKKGSSRKLKFLIKHENFAHQILDALVAVTTLSAGSYYLATHKETFERAVSIALFCIALGLFSFSLTAWLTGKLYSTVRRLMPGPCILLTQGDQDKKIEIEKMHSTTKTLFMLFFVSIILAGIVNLSSAFLYNAIFAK